MWNCHIGGSKVEERHQSPTVQCHLMRNDGFDYNRCCPIPIACAHNTEVLFPVRSSLLPIYLEHGSWAHAPDFHTEGASPHFLSASCSHTRSSPARVPGLLIQPHHLAATQFWPQHGRHLSALARNLSSPLTQGICVHEKVVARWKVTQSPEALGLQPASLRSHHNPATFCFCNRFLHLFLLLCFVYKMWIKIMMIMRFKKTFVSVPSRY